jgi:transposase
MCISCPYCGEIFKTRNSDDRPKCPRCGTNIRWTPEPEPDREEIWHPKLRDDLHG